MYVYEYACTQYTHKCVQGAQRHGKNTYFEMHISETRAYTVVIKSNYLGPVLAAIMRPGVFLTSLYTCREKRQAKTVLFDLNGRGSCSSLNNYAFQSTTYM